VFLKFVTPGEDKETLYRKTEIITILPIMTVGQFHFIGLLWSVGQRLNCLNFGSRVIVCILVWKVQLPSLPVCVVLCHNYADFFRVMVSSKVWVFLWWWKNKKNVQECYKKITYDWEGSNLWFGFWLWKYRKKNG